MSGIFESDYKKQGMVSQGAYGKVYLYKQKIKKENTQQKSQKANFVIVKKMMDKKSGIDQYQVRNKLGHSNYILPFLYRTKIVKPHTTNNILVMPLATPLSAIKIKSQHSKIIMANVLNGIYHMHKQNYMHRDIKPDNTFIYNGSIVIGDLGTSININDSKQGPAFTKYYKPPQVIYGMNDYNQKVDIWAAGCMYAQLLTGRILFNGKNDFQLIGLIIRLLGNPQVEWPQITKLPNFFSCQCKKMNIRDVMDIDQKELQVLQRMLRYNPDQRPSAKQLINEQIFKQLQLQDYLLKEAQIYKQKLISKNEIKK